MNNIFESLLESMKQNQNYNYFNQDNYKNINNINYHQFVEFLQKNIMLNLLTTKTLLDNNLDLLTKNFNEILLNMQTNQDLSSHNNKVDYEKIAKNIQNNSLECLQKNYSTIHENILHTVNMNSNNEKS
ncbi:MAG: hypothetical protein U1E31_00330 [Rickettsiales bacterium]